MPTIDCGDRTTVIEATKDQHGPAILASVEAKLAAVFGSPANVPDGVRVTVHLALLGDVHLGIGPRVEREDLQFVVAVIELGDGAVQRAVRRMAVVVQDRDVAAACDGDALVAGRREGKGVNGRPGGRLCF